MTVVKKSERIDVTLEPSDIESKIIEYDNKIFIEFISSEGWFECFALASYWLLANENYTLLGVSHYKDDGDYLIYLFVE